MIDQYRLFILISIFAAALCIGLIILVLNNRRTPVTSALVTLLICVSGWLTMTTCNRLSTDPGIGLVWAKLTYAFIGASAMAWINLALVYTGRYHLRTFRNMALMSVIPTLTLLLVLFNEENGWVWAHMTFRQVGPYWYFVAQYGPWFWVNAAYTYLLVGLSALMVVWEVLLEKQRIYRMQAICLVLGAILPMVWNLIYILHLLPGIPFDITPVGFALGCTLVALGMFRFRIFDLVPVAQQVLIENMPDGVIVLDGQDRVISLNPAAEWILNCSAKDTISRPFSLLFPNWHSDKWQTEQLLEVQLPRNGERHDYEMVSVALPSHNGRIMGWLVQLREITRRKQAEAALKLHGERLQTLVDAQTESLKLERDILSLIMDTSPVGIVLLDENRRITFVNRQVSEIIGLPSEQVIERANLSPAWDISDAEGRHIDRDDLALFDLLEKSQQVKDAALWLKNGAGQYITVEVNATPLLNSEHAFAGVVATISDITDRLGVENRLRHLATHDSLTSLPNRVLFSERLASAVKDAEAEGSHLAVVFLDLDNFKAINDAFTHEKGDELLKIIAERIRGCIRASDTVSRHGGDEFVILLEHISRQADIERVVRKILENVAAPVAFEQMEVVVTVSIGVAVYPLNTLTPSNLMQYADLAMYHAKKMGKNCYAFYSDEMAIRAYETLELAADLRHALDRDELVLYYQPIVDARQGRITALEALLRWNHPRLGLLAPDMFLPLAEESGLISAIGDWVLIEACRQGMAWQNQGLPPVRMHVNLAQKQVHAGLARRVTQALVETRFPAGLLELEMTEEIVCSEMTGFGALLNQLHRVGVRLAIDDFGSGQTSLSQLSTYPFDTVKIDRSITQDLEGNEHTRVVVSGLVGIARRLGMEVVAEGVETTEQVNFYCLCGCELFQGWYYFKAVDPATCAVLLAQAVNSPDNCSCQD